MMPNELNTQYPLGRIMLIDDMSFDLKLYRRILERSGQAEDIIEITDARDAVAYLQDDTLRPVDLILLDIQMPNMDGFEFLDAAQSYLGTEYATPVVMMLTTSLSPYDKERAATNRHVQGFLSKPLQADHLETLCTIVSGTRARVCSGQAANSTYAPQQQTNHT